MDSSVSHWLSRDDVGFKILLYSPDSWGLGHLRRNLAIATALNRRFADARILLITGSPCATQFELPSNCDILKLPAISKNSSGDYVCRSEFEDLSAAVELRRRLMLVAYQSFQPDCLLIDHKLTGLGSEAMPALRQARRDGRTILYGMRDVIDTPGAVQAEWNSPDARWALAEGYDRICIYGDPEVFNPCEQYSELTPLAEKTSFCGYIVPPIDPTSMPPVPSYRRTVLVTMGGGEDGADRIQTYLDALSRSPADWFSRIVTGPLMDSASLRSYRRQVDERGLTEHVRFDRFHPHVPRLLQAADAVVSMAGYNSCAEILQCGIPAVLMPRTHPRKEQLLRAQRFQSLGLGTFIDDPDPATLRNAVEMALAQPAMRRGGIALNGLDRICDIVSDTLREVPVAPRRALGSNKRPLFA